METFNQIITVIGMIAVMATIIMIIITVITGLIGVHTKKYKHFKTSLKILIVPVAIYVLTIIAFAIGQAAK